MRVSIYARYSSDKQREASIEDQVRLCEERAAREGWRVVKRYTDHAIPGASLLTNFLLPPGCAQTTAVQDSPFEPTIVYEVRFPLPALPAETEIVQEVVDLASGWRTQRASGGFTASIIIAGEVACRIGGERKVYKAGE